MTEQDLWKLLWERGHYRLSLYYARYVARSTNTPFVIGNVIVS